MILFVLLFCCYGYNIFSNVTHNNNQNNKLRKHNYPSLDHHQNMSLSLSSNLDLIIFFIFLFVICCILFLFFNFSCDNW